MIHRYFI